MQQRLRLPHLAALLVLPILSTACETTVRYTYVGGDEYPLAIPEGLQDSQGAPVDAVTLRTSGLGSGSLRVKRYEPVKWYRLGWTVADLDKESPDSYQNDMVPPNSVVL